MQLQFEAVRSQEWEKAEDSLSRWHLFPHFPYHGVKNVFFHLRLPATFCSTTILPWFKRSRGVMLMICSFFYLLKGNLNCLPEAWFALLMLKRVRGRAVNGYSVGVKVFLSSRLNSEGVFSYWNTNCHVCLKLKCGVLSLAYSFHIQMNVKGYLSHILKEWAEELISAAYCSFESTLFIIFWYFARQLGKGR